MLKTKPAVFAVGDKYHIMVPVEGSTLMWVRVGNKNYYDESNGILRQIDKIHRMIIPADELNKEKRYTICERPVIERVACFSKTGEVTETEFDFTPVEKGKEIRAYHISDTHNRVETPVKAALDYGKIDFLIMNGDVPNDSQETENFNTIYEIASQITGGNIPIVFARGNHDLRGIYAEKIADYTPNQYGNTYFTFKLGNIWGIVLDCGEDKDDDRPEYGNTICCHALRERQTDFIKSVIENSENEFLDSNVKYRVVIAHNPFTQLLGEPFNIESDIYKEWAALLKEYVKPDIMLCGHTHKYGLHEVGGEFDTYGQPCPVVIGSEPRRENYIGCGIVFNGNEIKIEFNDALGEKLESYIVRI